MMYTLAWLEMGWNVVNVEYRLAGAATAPGAVEDCLCALRWVVSHAAQYRIDPARIGRNGGFIGRSPRPDDRDGSGRRGTGSSL